MIYDKIPANSTRFKGGRDNEIEAVKFQDRGVPTKGRGDEILGWNVCGHLTFTAYD